jgi:gluconolactonase
LCRQAQLQEKQYPALGTIERPDHRLDQIVPRDARVERLAEGFRWAEGPVWDRHGFLLFSDVPQNTVFLWQEGKGVSVYLKPSGYTATTPRGGEPGSNGLLIDDSGRLVLCQHGDRRIARLQDDRSFATLADRYQGKRLNSPNDGVFKSNKALWMAFPVKDDGRLEEGRVFADVTSSVGSKKGLPDGMKVDQAGNLFATGPGGVLNFAPDGTHLGTLATGEATANCGWGEDGSVLYITAHMYLGRIKLTTKGLGYQAR